MKVTVDRAVLEQALEAMLFGVKPSDRGPLFIDAITTLRQALEAAYHHPVSPELEAEINKAIAEPVQAEPVANKWSVFNSCVEVWADLSLADAVAELSPDRLERGWTAVCVLNKDNPPFTAPQRTWVGLTDEDIESLWEAHHTELSGWDYGGHEVMTEYRFEEAARAIEAKLREKNGGGV